MRLVSHWELPGEKSGEVTTEYSWNKLWILRRIYLTVEWRVKSEGKSQYFKRIHRLRVTYWIKHKRVRIRVNYSQNKLIEHAPNSTHIRVPFNFYFGPSLETYSIHLIANNCMYNRAIVQSSCFPLKWGASSRWSFSPKSSWRSIETRTIRKAHHTLGPENMSRVPWNPIFWTDQPLLALIELISKKNFYSKKSSG